MIGQDLHLIRKSLGLSRQEFARMLGYTGSDDNVESSIRKFENGRKLIPLYIARLALMIGKFHFDNGCLPEFPDYGDRYKFQPEETENGEVEQQVT